MGIRRILGLDRAHVNEGFANVVALRQANEQQKKYEPHEIKPFRGVGLREA